MKEMDYENIFLFSKKSKKYPLKLTEAIKFLLDKQRVIEAKYHFMELERLNPNHKAVIGLGFDIGMKTFDRTMVSKYDELLSKNSAIKNIDLSFKRLLYWISVNNDKNI